MPLNKKGKEIMGNMESEYGAEKGKKVFYASKNKGTISGVEGKKNHMAGKMKVKKTPGLENYRKTHPKGGPLNEHPSVKRFREIRGY